MSENEFAGSPAGPAARSGRLTRRGLDEAALRLISALLGKAVSGRLRLTLPSGATTLFGSPGTGREAGLTINAYRLVWSALRRGTIGFADSYMDGDCDSADLNALCHFHLDNEAAIERAGAGFFRPRAPDRRFHLANRNSRQGSRRNIAAHYDLGNDFYRLWLDAGMTYSSGIYLAPGTSLEVAQAVKHARILDALALAPGHRLFEIGCGWGSFVEAAARRGAHVTGITISEAQLADAQRRLAAAGLDGNTEIRFEDYRDSTGTFDRLVSIEMIEAVGEENWPAFFDTVAARLAPGGIGVVQAITIREDLYAGYRANPDFIQRYIFPGGMLPTVSAMVANSLSAGLAFDTIETFGASYASTLHDWRQRYHAAAPEIRKLGFDDRFLRMWDYYLTYCAVGFERGMIDVGIYRLRKAG